MTYSAQLIVLHSIKYTDTSLLVYAYTNLFGRQTYILRGIRTAKKHGAAAHFFPLSILDAEVYHKPGANIQNIKEFHPAIDLGRIRTNLYKSSIALFLGEMLYRSIQEVEANESMYNLLFSSIYQLNSADTGVADFHLHFLVRFAVQCGYTPKNNYHPEQAPLFDISQGAFVSPREASGYMFPREESRLLHRLLLPLNGSPPPEISLNGNQRYQFVNEMIRYLSYHLDMPLDLKSPEVLKQLFA